MREVDTAWAAGFLDGEGSLTLRRQPPRATRGGLRYTAKISAGNTDLSPLRRLESLFGGTVRRARPTQGRHNALWSWEITGNERVERCLVAISPYLTVKQAEAGVLLGAIRSMSRWKPGVALSDEETERRDSAVTRLKELKGRLP